MKKFNYTIILSAIVAAVCILSSCNSNNQSSPEDEVRSYGNYFAEKIAANQLDSLKTSYPDIALADSIVPLKGDSITVEALEAGKYKIALAKDVTLMVNRSEDGNIQVTESKGLFAYPSDKLVIAQKTGMYDKALSDAELSKRMKDEDFFKYIREQMKKKTAKILSVGDWVSTPDMIYKVYSIKNNTDQTIEGSDYTITIAESYPFDIPHSDPNNWHTTYSTKPGKTIPPHGTYKYKTEIVYGGSAGEHVKGVKLKLTPEQIQERFGTYTGKEYQEYLDTKK